jgi:hypothetical protein
MPGWTWRHTPGHTPGHVALFREQDRVLLAGDAVVTVDLDSTLAVLTKKRGVYRPPSPATYDWNAAEKSIRLLADLRPYTLATGHGLPLSGPQVAPMLDEFADNFQAPNYGRYVAEPAQFDEARGVVVLPSPVPDPLPKVAAGVAAAALVGAGIYFAAGAVRHGDGQDRDTDASAMGDSEGA